MYKMIEVHKAHEDAIWEEVIGLNREDAIRDLFHYWDALSDVARSKREALRLEDDRGNVVADLLHDPWEVWIRPYDREKGYLEPGLWERIDFEPPMNALEYVENTFVDDDDVCGRYDGAEVAILIHGVVVSRRFILKENVA